MVFKFLFLDTVDSSLGRVDHESFSHQTLMEMVIQGTTDKRAICGDPDEPKSIEDWKGVVIADDEVVEINWRNCGFTGSLCLEWLPSSVREFAAFHNGLTGTLECAALPTAMKKLGLGDNAFTGQIDLETLPERMELINVCNNELSGSLKLESLSDTLTHFVTSSNQFSGSVDLTQLPVALVWLDLSENQLSANPTKGHLSVVGWTSTPVLGEAKNLFKPLVVFLSWRRPY
ncbi:hypothetical protein XU18_2069 [Perkinsela sp. CCAP 1560/4]|nr:hypothetical protein XU18_2069 [Perkinsela sp. CCAP 1560/4]|eukprot:KNH07537.1 hypothetical protein XU18_2069 [Perkinsela sp. CCAP 1560/4]